jgi:hypothetical protein
MALGGAADDFMAAVRLAESASPAYVEAATGFSFED